MSFDSKDCDCEWMFAGGCSSRERLCGWRARILAGSEAAWPQKDQPLHGLACLQLFRFSQITET